MLRSTFIQTYRVLQEEFALPSISLLRKYMVLEIQFRSVKCTVVTVHTYLNCLTYQLSCCSQMIEPTIIEKEVKFD